eukprot:7124386-Pyramimonas_sp.AAC.1
MGVMTRRMSQPPRRRKRSRRRWCPPIWRRTLWMPFITPSVTSESIFPTPRTPSDFTSVRDELLHRTTTVLLLSETSYFIALQLFCCCQRRVPSSHYNCSVAVTVLHWAGNRLNKADIPLTCLG